MLNKIEKDKMYVSPLIIGLVFFILVAVICDRQESNCSHQNEEDDYLLNYEETESSKEYK